MRKNAKIVDVSKWQDLIDWNKMKAALVDGVYIKMSAGDTVLDPFYKSNWEKSKLAELPRGIYHWFAPVVEPKLQAVWIEKNYPVDAELPIAIDVEDTRKTTDYAAKLAWLLSWAKERYGKTPVIYTGYYYWIERFGLFQHWAEQYSLWIGGYRDFAGPLVPRPWSPNNWTIWQYTAKGDSVHYGTDKYKCKQIDLNEFNGTKEDLLVWANM